MPDPTEIARARARVERDGSGNVNVTTGSPVLDHLLGLLARRARFDLALEVAPGSVEAELTTAGHAVGEALHDLLREADARGEGYAGAPAADALAVVALEATETPLFVSNVDFSRERVAGIEGDVISRFLHELAEAASLTLHVRLIDGSDRQNVLEAIFKALGSALAVACRP